MKHLGVYIILAGFFAIALSVLIDPMTNFFLGTGMLLIIAGLVAYIQLYKKTDSSQA